MRGMLLDIKGAVKLPVAIIFIEMAAQSQNSPSAPKKEAPLQWQDPVRRNLSHEEKEERRAIRESMQRRKEWRANLREAERRANLQAAEEAVKRRRLAEKEETEERFLWLRPDFKVKPLDGPFYFEDGTAFYL